MKKQMIQPLFAFGMALVFAGCATTSKPAEMTAADEARYTQAIEKAEAQTPSPIQDDTEYTVVVGESAASGVAGRTGKSTGNAVQGMPAADTPAARTFAVSKTEYDAFFAQSPAVVLGRMTLDPIVDGGTLLGYRIKDIRAFPGVDLANEDIVVGIDGKLPQNPDDYFNAWEACKAKSDCTVNIQRGVDRFKLEWKAE